MFNIASEGNDITIWADTEELEDGRTYSVSSYIFWMPIFAFPLAIFYVS